MTRLHLRRSPWLTTLLLLAGLGTSAAEEPPRGPATRAEASGFQATSRHQDVMSFIVALQQQSPNIRLETLCTSTEGRQVPVLVIGDPVPSSPAEMDGRAAVYFQANIHAGEVEGKEALLMVARDLLQGPSSRYLDRLVVLLAPIFNADGNERISTEHRRRQAGPAQGVGIRYNGQNLDLNRDGMKRESPEVRGLIRNVLVRWDPILFFDAHTHNGSYHREPVTWTWGLNPNGDTALIDYSAQIMWPAIENLMRDRHGILTIPHGDFLDPRNPEQGWTTLGPQPRYLSNYVGLRNRLSVLNENYPYVEFEKRVRGCYSLVLSFLDFMHGQRDEIVALQREADRKAVERGGSPSEDDGFILEYDRRPIDRRFTILGYEMEVEESDRPWPRVTRSDEHRTYSEVPYLAHHTAKRTIRFPAGYLLGVRDQTVLDTLRGHGVTVEELSEGVTLAVEAFTVAEIGPSERLNQGHYTNTAKGEYAAVERQFPKGTPFVSTAQPLGSLAASLLEAESDDGLLVWNFFDRYLSRQWGLGTLEYPVYRLLEPLPLAKSALR